MQIILCQNIIFARDPQDGMAKAIMKFQFFVRRLKMSHDSFDFQKLESLKDVGDKSMSVTSICW